MNADCVLCSAFVVSVLQILVIDIVLSIDNALIISLATRHIPPQQQRVVVPVGIALAIVLRIAFTFIASFLLTVKGLNAVGGILLIIISLKLALPSKTPSHTPHQHAINSIATILLADIIMSIDNVLAIAGIAQQNTLLLIIGIVISLPILAISSRIMISLITRFPWIIDLGATVLAYTGGKMLTLESLWTADISTGSATLVPWLTAALVLCLLPIIRWIQESPHEPPPLSK